MSETRTELSELGEFGLIDHLTKEFKTKREDTVKSIGDDAAVIDRGDHLELISTDMLVEGIHFDMTYTPWKHLGYKSMAINFSDIAAMNGLPTQVVVSLALSNRFPVEAIEELYEGMQLACETYGVDFVGGDTTSSLTGLIICPTVIGRVEKEKVAYRSGAKENDLICVSGNLGGAYIGLQILEREKKIWKENPNVQPDLSGHDFVIERILKPEPRTDIVKALADKGVVPTSMIDISDGLGSEILHICKQSNCGVRIFEDKLPIDPTVVSQAKEFNLEPSVCALNGGEDYELLFTISQSDFEKVKDMPDVSFIGHIADANSGAGLVYPQGELIEIKSQGWKAF